MGTIKAKPIKPIEKYIESYLNERIPLTRAIAVSVTCFDDEHLAMEAPLAPNINHANTAFGGSIATLGITANWSMLHFSLHVSGRDDIKIVIQKSQVEFLLPAEEVIRANTERIPEEQLDSFIKKIDRFGRARISLSSKIYSAGNLVAIHKGSYVGLLKKNDEDDVV